MEIMGITDTRWKTATQLGVSDPRALKANVQLHNMNYGKGDEPSAKWYILSGRHGYKLTKDFDEIAEDLERRKNNLKKAMKRVSNVEKQLERMRNKASMGELL